MHLSRDFVSRYLKALHLERNRRKGFRLNIDKFERVSHLAIQRETALALFLFETRGGLYPDGTKS